MATIQHYTQPHQFEPLLPTQRLDALRLRTRGVVQAAYRLSASAHPSTIATLRGLVREMNTYYSNRIEGQGTHPANIARALRRDFSAQPKTAQLQRIALAHIEAEQELEQKLAAGAQPLTSRFLCEAHHALYSRLSEEDRTTEDGRIVKPGLLREESVSVGRHEPPPGAYVPAFLARMDAVYSKPCSLEDSLIVIAAAHQRAAWVHPFSDGNGRASRLQAHCALWPLSSGLWSVSRGMARLRDQYYERLDAADAPRHGDLHQQRHH